MKLGSCKRCGGQGFMRRLTYPEFGNSQSCYGKCKKCGSITTEYPLEEKPKAIEAWNNGEFDDFNKQFEDLHMGKLHTIDYTL